MQNQEKNNSFLPSWMCETEQYVPSIDKDGFITKSTQAVLGVLSKLKWKEGKDGCLSASPSLKLCYTFLYILLTACSKNYVFSLIMAGGTILALATYPAEINETDTFGDIWSSTFFCTNTFTGSVYRKSADFAYYHNQSVCIRYAYRYSVSGNILE